MNTGYSAGFQEVMSKRMQRIHHKIDVFRAITSFEEQANLKKGDTVHRLAKTLPIVQTYTRGTAMTIGSHTETDESLVVSVSKVAPFYVDDMDQLQFNFKYQMEFGEDMAKKLGNFIDGDVLGEYDQASNTIDDLTVNPSAGTSGNGVLVTASNIQKVFAIAQRKLTKAKIEMTNRFAVVGPEFYQTLVEYLASKNTPLADEVGKNGYVGKYLNFELFLSNATGWSGAFVLSVTPTANDTVTINGVTFKFVSTIGSTAGNVLFTTAADANTNLTALINTPGTTTANGVALTTANQALMTGIVATAAATSTTLKSEGQGAIAVSQSMTSASNLWTAATEIEHILFGRKGAIDVVIQSEPKIEIKEVPDKLGKNVIPWTLYGLKTFTEGKAMLVDCKVRTDQY